MKLTRSKEWWTRKINQLEGTMTGPNFHWRNGIYFDRLPDGSVSITGVADAIPAAEWASIVAAVSKAGETGETYRAALKFHNGGADDQP